MEGGKKRTYMKPEMRFVTDFHIILECIYEVYGQEKQHVLDGKDITKTMIFPFLKMLESHCDGITLEEIHKMLWREFSSVTEKNQFMEAVDRLLQPYRKETEECGMQ